MYLLDTNICIYLLKQIYPVLNSRVTETDPADIYISSITIYELEYGAFKSKWGDRTRNNLHTFLAPFTFLPFDVPDAIAAGQIRSDLTNLGTPIGPYDILIAAQGIARKLTVITHNVKEFERVPGLQVEDWTL